MKADLKGIFVLDAILGLLIGIVINEFFAGMKMNYTGGFPGLPRSIPATLDIPGTAFKTDNFITWAVCLLPAIFMTGRIKNIFIWAFYTQLTWVIYSEVNILIGTIPPAK